MSVLKPEFPDHGSPFSREAERERKVAAITSAAAARFNRLGVRGTRQEDIAADLGLTKTSISYYFACKEDLAAAVFERAAGLLETVIAEAEAAPGSAASRLLRLFEADARAMDAIVAGRRPRYGHVQELDFLKDEARARISDRLGRVIKRVDALVAAWIEETGAPLGRSEPATYLVFALLDWLNGQADQLDRDRFKDAAQTVLSLLRSGLWRGAAAASPGLTPGYAAAGHLPQIFDRETRNRMKREAFLQVGVRYFNAHGFEGVSLADVAAALGVTRGAFYYHIPDKLDFLDQCLDRSFTIVEGALDDAGDRSGLDAIRYCLVNLIYRQASGLTPLIRPALMSALPATRRKRYEARHRNISRRFGDWLTDAMEAGEAPELDVDPIETLLARLVFLNGGYTVAAAQDVYELRLSEDPIHAAADYCFILQYGLQP
ncbi:MAG: TetR/AcrR family transcriptional regulator [Oceanicaulis sp.]